MGDIGCREGDVGQMAFGIYLRFDAVGTQVFYTLLGLAVCQGGREGLTAAHGIQAIVVYCLDWMIRIIIDVMGRLHRAVDFPCSCE